MTTCSKEGTKIFKELADSPQRVCKQPAKGRKGHERAEHARIPCLDGKAAKSDLWPHFVPNALVKAKQRKQVRAL